VLNPAPLTVPLAESEVNAPVLVVVDPMGPGAANVAPPSVAALMDVLQAAPDPLAHVSALDAVLHPGMGKAVGLALEPVAFARIVFAACAAKAPGAISPVAVRLPVTVNPEMDGDVARTGEPDPVTAFARPVATPVPRPETPVEIGSPVPFVNVTAEGVPRFGVTSVGEFDSTAEPVPVAVVVPVPPFAAVSGF
jgi:hypothetical protein